MVLFCHKFFLVLIMVLISVAFLTLIERKILGFIMFRLGPNKVSFMGVLQPITDALKLSNKSYNLLSNSSFFFYHFSSFLLLLGSILFFTIFLCSPSTLNISLSFLVLALILSSNSLNSILAGWSIFSKFSLLGSIRTVSQLISYEAVIFICFFFIIINWNNYDFNHIQMYDLNYLMLIYPFCFYIWVPTILAELNRTPYDFSEGESELVSGFNTEFGSVSFTLIFLSEYSNILFFSFLSSFFFFSFSFLIFLIHFFFICWVRSALPRYRFDKLMSLCWCFFIPFLTILFMSSLYF